MKALPEDMEREVRQHLFNAEKALSTARSLIRAPAGHRPETLEDALNELQDQAYQARRAFRVEAAR